MYIIGVVAVLGLLHTINEQYKLTPIDWFVMSLTSWWGIGSVLETLNQMRLSNQQIEAILDKIEEKQSAKSEAEYKRRTEEEMKKKQALANEYYLIYKKLPLRLKSMIRGYSAVTRTFILNQLVDVQRPSDGISRRELKNKIILASIDVKTMDELKKKLNISL
jgi:hypothetical protein